jgi:hypothetical protein
MHVSVQMLFITHSPPTCSGHSCGHLQEGVTQNIVTITKCQKESSKQKQSHNSCTTVLPSLCTTMLLSNKTAKQSFIYLYIYVCVCVCVCVCVH